MPETKATRIRPAGELVNDQRPRSLEEQLQTAVNAQITDTVTKGIEGIDRLKQTALKHLSARGLTGLEEIGDSAADLVKRLLVRGISK